MEHLAQESRFTFNFASIDKDTWNRASEDSRPQAYRPTIDPAPLLPVFLIATQDRPAAAPAPSTPAAYLSRAQASYPHPATDATRAAYDGRSGSGRPSGYRGPGRGTETPGVSR